MDIGRSNNGRKRRPLGREQSPRDLPAVLAASGGPDGGYYNLLGAHQLRHGQSQDPAQRTGGIYGRRHVLPPASSSLHRTRLFPTTPATTAARTFMRASSTSSTRHLGSSTSRKNRTSAHRRPSVVAASHNNNGGGGGGSLAHVVCAVSENLARETCVASLDAGAPVHLQVTKQGNGQTYAETLSCLEILQPHEILLNEGRRHSQLARKILELYQVNNPVDTDRDHFRPGRQRNNSGLVDNNEADDPYEELGMASIDRYGSLQTNTVVKFVSRSCFDQTRGAELLRRVAREETYDATVVEEYILLSSAHAVLLYTQQCLGASFTRNSVFLSVNADGNNRMTIDRSSVLQLELLCNSRTGKAPSSLVGTIDFTKTTVGSRLLRTNLMSPPTRADTVNARLELVDTFLGSEEFFYSVHEHLQELPDINKMLANIALVPDNNQFNNSSNQTKERLASRGISALVCIKSTLSALPSFASVLKSRLDVLDHAEDDIATVVTDRTSLLVGLGGGQRVHLQKNHLLRAILESTTCSRDANAMRHQECFALKSDSKGFMNVLRKAFLANVDDIYKKADEYAEVYGMCVAVRYTASRGYFLAVPSDHGTSLPAVFLQPAKSGRFVTCTTEEVASLNSRAQENVHDLLLMTRDRIQDVLDVARSNYDAIAALCDAVALLDMCHSFADNVTLSTLPWCRPVVTEYSLQDSSSQLVYTNAVISDPATNMIIRSGRYAVDVPSVGDVAPNQPASFIPNDTYASRDESFTVITGINGSGKSTYLKQIGIIVVLAHCGSYVPAEQASIPLRDRLCCRIGNGDDQEHNISTFLLEMKEVATICNNATDRSLVLVDELGRATSNEDGVAIAWSISEYLLKKKAMTFFVTHYPQLSRLGDVYPSVQNIHLEASLGRGEEGDISYMHRVRPGACPLSTDYGVELAAACGWPQHLYQSARSLQDQVSQSLPDDTVCGTRSDQPELSTYLSSYRQLNAIANNLRRLVSDEELQSLSSIRSKLLMLADNFDCSGKQKISDVISQLLGDAPLIATTTGNLSERHRNDEYVLGQERQDANVPASGPGQNHDSQGEQDVLRSEHDILMDNDESTLSSSSSETTGSDDSTSSLSSASTSSSKSCE